MAPWSRILLLLLAVASIITGVNSVDTATAKCSPEAQQFSVVVATSAPLGLRLSDKLEVLEFVADSEGRGRAVEASGLAEIGDRLIAVNDVSLEGFALQKAVAELQAAELPRTLRFQTHDGRCIQPPPAAIKESVIEAATASAFTYDPSNEETFDYVVASVGDKTTEFKLYAVLSSDGSPPSCAFRELVLARPFDGCSPLSIDVTNKYVLVPSVFGCPMHQKAAMADEAGAKGVIFVQRVGEKPMRVRIPPASSLPHPINIPLVMVSTDSGARLLEQMAAVRPGESQQLRFVFSAACAVDRFAVHPASSLAAAVAVQQTSIPVVFISMSAFRTIRQKLKELEDASEINTGDDSNTHIHVEFSGENALEHQWKELAGLAVESNWPASEAARDRLFHRMLKDQATLDDHDLQLSLVKNERYEALVAAYWSAQRYYSARTDDDLKDDQGESGSELEDER
ncbi:Protease-associated domain, PA [Phytophthora cinnamomi]|uniref:Protease-associated domain, PA n=1 Tax=Phytophthora cinnamomi TaxID=4785 RepID=UPI00355AC0C4|nr:Protease-associated domain, PA [Phytophthora cinnamomi]